MQHLLIVIPIILASFGGYFISYFMNEPTHWFLIVINFNVGLFSYACYLVVTHKGTEEEKEKSRNY